MGTGSFLYRSAWSRSSASHFLWKPEFVPSFLSVRGHPCCGSWCLSPGLSAVHSLGPPSHPSPLAAARCGALLWRCTRFCRLSGSPSSFFGSFAHTLQNWGLRFWRDPALFFPLTGRNRCCPCLSATSTAGGASQPWDGFGQQGRWGIVCLLQNPGRH